MEPIKVKTVDEIEAGDEAVYVEGQALGAWPNGSRIAKIDSEKGDRHRDGAAGMVLSSLVLDSATVYFVLWDDCPHMPIAIMGHRLRLV